MNQPTPPIAKENTMTAATGTIFGLIWQLGRNAYEELWLLADVTDALKERVQKEWAANPLRVITGMLAGRHGHQLFWWIVILFALSITAGYYPAPIWVLALGWLTTIIFTGLFWALMKTRQVQFAAIGLMGMSAYYLGVKPAKNAAKNALTFGKGMASKAGLGSLNFLLSALPSWIIEKEERESIINTLKGLGGNQSYQKLLNEDDGKILKEYWQKALELVRQVEQVVLSVILVQGMWLTYFLLAQPRRHHNLHSNQTFLLIWGLVMAGASVGIIIAAGREKMKQGVKIAIWTIVISLFLGSGLAIYLISKSREMNANLAEKGMALNSRTDSRKIVAVITRTVPSDRIRNRENVELRAPAGLEKFFQLGQQVEIEPGSISFMTKQDKQLDWFVSARVYDEFQHDAFSQLNGGKLWVLIPQRCILATTSTAMNLPAKNGGLANYQALEYHGKDTWIAKLHKGDVVQLLPSIIDSTVMGKQPGRPPICCWLEGMWGDPPFDRSNLRWPKHQFGSLGIEWPGGSSTLTADTLIIAERDGDLIAGINEHNKDFTEPHKIYPCRCYDNNKCQIGVWYEIHSAL
ncbi:MAG: hypothetical protein NTV81_02415 [Candidatus Komeilibacteria bacterium]|nr:hypothetical protein [Candidatus Komeilibacteria bacterium]